MQKVSQSNFKIDTAVSTTVTAPIELNGAVVEAFITPASLNSTTMTFEASMDGARGTRPLTGQYLPVRDTTGALISVTVSANDWIVVDHRALSGCRWLRAVMGTAEANGATIGVVLGGDG